MNALFKQKRAMRCGTRKPRKLKLRCYAACLIYLNGYLFALPEAKASYMHTYPYECAV